MVLRLGVIAALLCLLAACGSKPPPPVSPPVTLRPPPTDATDSCLASLDRRHVGYDRISDFHTNEGCGIDQAIKLKSLEIPLNHPLLLACSTALNLADFETRVVTPAAQATLGHPVKLIASAGSYDCRGQRSDHPERLSEHALGRAIDITGFTLDDGSRITVAQHWWGTDARAAFLHQVAAGACTLFSVVLTPKSNRLHHDHLHLDSGLHHKCDA